MLPHLLLDLVQLHRSSNKKILYKNSTECSCPPPVEVGVTATGLFVATVGIVVAIPVVAAFGVAPNTPQFSRIVLNNYLMCQ